MGATQLDQSPTFVTLILDNVNVFLVSQGFHAIFVKKTITDSPIKGAKRVTATHMVRFSLNVIGNTESAVVDL